MKRRNIIPLVLLEIIQIDGIKCQKNMRLCQIPIEEIYRSERLQRVNWCNIVHNGTKRFETVVNGTKMEKRRHFFGKISLWREEERIATWLCPLVKRRRSLLCARAFLENSSQLVKSFVATVKHAFSLSSLPRLVAFLFCLTARVSAIGATVTLTFQPHRGTHSCNPYIAGILLVIMILTWLYHYRHNYEILSVLREY